MKLNKEYRILLLIVIPYLFLVIVHLLIPIQFNFLITKIGIQGYNQQTRTLGTVVKQNQLLQNQDVGKNIIEKYKFWINLVKEEIGVEGKFMEVNKVNVELNSAGEFQSLFDSNLTSNNSFKEPVSMWFSENQNNESNLDNFQLSTLNDYKSIQLFIRSSFHNSFSSQSLIGISTYYQQNGSSIEFIYPSQFIGNYNSSNISSSFLESFYLQTIENFDTFNSTFSTFDEINNENQSLLILCDVIDDRKGVVCLNFSFDLLLQQFSTLFGVLLGTRQTNSKVQFIMPLGINETIPQEIGSITNLKGEGMLTNIQKMNFSEPQISSWSYASVLPFPQFTHYFAKEQSSLTTSIKISDLQDKKSNILFIQIDYKYNNIENFEQNTDSLINILLILSISLLTLSFIFTVLVLRSLMNNLNDEMNKLASTCKFIVDDDINIEIQKFKGTKDIAQMYELAETINKIHRFTSKNYFVGYFPQKILKYHSALHLFRKLGYWQGHILQNIGENYYHLEEFEKSRQFLHKSVDLQEEKMKKEFPEINKMVYVLSQKRRKLPSRYKEMENQLIRKLFKLSMPYYRDLITIQLNKNKKQDQQIDQNAKKSKTEALRSKMFEIFEKLNLPLYPNFHFYSQSVTLEIFLASYYLVTFNLFMTQKSLAIAQKRLDKYSQVFQEEEKQKQNIVIRNKKRKKDTRKIKITNLYSRTQPQMSKQFISYYKGLLAIYGQQNYIKAFQYFCEGSKKNRITHHVNFLLVIEFIKGVVSLQLFHMIEKMESTQIYRQSLPCKTLFYGEVTPEIDKNFMRFPSTNDFSQGEFLFLFDTALDNTNMTQKTLKDNQKYCYQIIKDIFKKKMKSKDRLSIISFNSLIQIETSCNLIYKESGMVGLQQLKKCIQRQQMKGKTILGEVLPVVVNRVKNLQSKKNILLFLKRLEYYKNYKIEIIKKQSRKTSNKRISISHSDIKLQPETSDSNTLLFDLGEQIVNCLKEKDLRNCSLIIILAKEDTIEDTKLSFNLEDINRRIWKHWKGINRNNNTVYIIQHKNRQDMDRVLETKVDIIPDNHIFIL